MEYPPIYRVYAGKTYTSFQSRESALMYYAQNAAAVRVTVDYGREEVVIR
jgi:viroplasmin and RNaseH domain-containing protein